MKFSIRFADQIVGTLVILALAILVFVVFMLGRSQRWFVRDSLYKTYFTSASGLSNNMEIKYKGFTIGHVKNFFLTEDDTVEVTLSIYEEHSQRVREGSLVEVQVSPIGLGNSFVFYPGKGSELIPEGMEIPEINSAKGKMIIAAGMVDRPEASDSISSILSQVPVILGDLDALLKTIDVSLSGAEGADELTLGKTMFNLESTTSGLTALAQELSNQISPILDNLKVLTDELSDPSGTVMAVLSSEGSLGSDLSSAIESLAGIIDNLEKSSEFIPAQLPQIGVMIGDIGVMLRSAQDVLVAVMNNPLLKGGIPEHKETGPGAASPRDMKFN
jgi:phospholipid/cholesterol/gamma-HCH transport system substrate-binding protein